MVSDVLYSSNSDEWYTPQPFFAALDAEFHFTLDAAATHKNAKCAHYFTKEDDALQHEWKGTVWCNPPYGRKITDWIKKASDSARNGATVVLLVHARTDTRWFHDYIYRKHEIRFVRGRIKFGGAENNAPFPSMVVVMRPSDFDQKEN